MVQIKHFAGGTMSTREFDEKVFGERVLGRTLKDALVMYEANRRAGTANTRERGEVAGGNKKLWKQKHTGRARMGTTKSPLWPGGGKVFGPHPRDYSYHMPVKARRVALRSALLSKFSDGEVTVLDAIPSGERVAGDKGGDGMRPKTKAAMAVLKAAGAASDALIVTSKHDTVLAKSLRNVPGLTLRSQADLNAWDVLSRKTLVITAEALQALQDRLSVTAAAGAPATGDAKTRGATNQ